MKFIYHATLVSNLLSIIKHGLLTDFYGAIHGNMDIAPPEKAIYLSRNEYSNNLNARLFDLGEVVVLKIDASGLDEAKKWPDDFIYSMWIEEEILTSTEEVAFALDKI